MKTNRFDRLDAISCRNDTALSMRPEACQLLRHKVFKQPQYDPITVEAQAAILWTAQNGHFDDVAVEKIKDCQSKLTEYLADRKSDLMAKVAKEKALSDALTAELKAAVMEFKQTYK